jgi:hypothetical protein
MPPNIVNAALSKVKGASYKQEAGLPQKFINKNLSVAK